MKARTASRGLQSRRPPGVRRLVTAALTVTVCAATGVALAAPSGGNVVGGEGSIDRQGANTLIEQASERMAIDWASFDVAPDETVTFVQPGATSLALNRILSEDPSRILGTVQANGRIILANPHGILFGADAHLDVGSLIASGLAIETDEYIQGDLRFESTDNTAGQVFNQGIINAATGGNIALLGKQVTNTGAINATLGRVVLASAHEAVISFDEQGLLGLKVGIATLRSDLEGTYGVVNMGDITAAGGGIVLTASAAEDLFSQAVNRGEYRDATTAVVNDDGSFSLGAGRGVFSNGKLDVSAPSGAAGMIALAGERVTHNGKLQANSGDAAAGTIRLQASDRLHLHAGSHIAALGADKSGRVALQGNSVNAAPGARVESSGYATFNAFSTMRLPAAAAEHLLVTGLSNLTQTGALTAAGNLHLATQTEADVNLLNPLNDFGSLSLVARYVSNIAIVESNDLVLGDLAVRDSTLDLRLMGEQALLTQAGGALIELSDSLFKVQAPSLRLGDAAAAIRLRNSALELNFAEQITTQGAIDLGGADSFSTATILDRTNSLRLLGTETIELEASVADDGIEIGAMVGRSARISAARALSQSGAIVLSENLNLESAAYTDLILDDPENSIASLNADLGYSSFLQLANGTNLILRDIRIDGAIMELAVQGTVLQDVDTGIEGLEGALTISAESIFLGGRGTSHIELLEIGNLELNFRDWLVLDGPVRLGGEYASFLVRGTEGINGIIVGEYGIFDSRNSFVEDLRINLGAGDDQVLLLRSFDVPLFVGEGADTISVADLNVIYDVPDFAFGEDEVLVLEP